MIMEMHIKVSRWENDLAIRIPKDVAEAMNLHEGDFARIGIDSAPPHEVRKKRKKWTGAELLEGVTPEMCGPEIIADRVGKELL